jgi:DNA segregation ATPase FtsK/SpoIIIE-like protein
MQNIVLAVAATNTPSQAKIVLIDPKQGVDYFPFEGLPHLDGPLIVESTEAASRLERLVVEMDERYVKLRAGRVQNLGAYNERMPEGDRLPVIWVVHDEFAEWMMVEDYKEAVTNVVGRLGVKARAAGIHLVFAAQRPDANVMPMQLRANLGNRLILKVDSAVRPRSHWARKVPSDCLAMVICLRAWREHRRYVTLRFHLLRRSRAFQEAPAKCHRQCHAPSRYPQLDSPWRCYLPAEQTRVAESNDSTN